MHIYQPHPEYLFRVKFDTVSKTFDQALGLAAVTAGIRDMKFGFFERFGDAVGYQGNSMHDLIPLLSSEISGGVRLSLDSPPPSIPLWVARTRPSMNLVEFSQELPK